MTEKPIVSFIVLFKGLCTHLLTHTLDSILSQTKKNYELILVLSPSAERESSIIQGYRNAFAHIYVSLSEDVTFMMRKGARLARGSYLQFLTPGDYFLSHHAVEIIEDFSREKGNPDLISTGYIFRGKVHFEQPQKKEIPKLLSASLVKYDFFDKEEKTGRQESMRVVLIDHESCTQRLQY